MNGTNGKQSDRPEIALVSCPVILAATKGDPDAMRIVLQHFIGCITSLSMRKLCNERGNVYSGVDGDIRERLQARLMDTKKAAVSERVYVSYGDVFGGTAEETV